LNATAADSLSAACIGCVQDLNINSVTGSKLTSTIPVSSVPSGSSNYIQNTMSQQASSNFNISGNGTAGGTLSANIVNATMQYDVNGSRLLGTAGLGNLFVGVAAGQANTPIVSCLGESAVWRRQHVRRGGQWCIQHH
jgi:hypothetical protein